MTTFTGVVLSIILPFCFFLAFIIIGNIIGITARDSLDVYLAICCISLLIATIVCYKKVKPNRGEAWDGKISFIIALLSTVVLITYAWYLETVERASGNIFIFMFMEFYIIVAVVNSIITLVVIKSSQKAAERAQEKENKRRKQQEQITRQQEAQLLNRQMLAQEEQKKKEAEEEERKKKEAELRLRQETQAREERIQKIADKMITSPAGKELALKIIELYKQHINAADDSAYIPTIKIDLTMHVMQTGIEYSFAQIGPKDPKKPETNTLRFDVLGIAELNSKEQQIGAARAMTSIIQPALMTEYEEMGPMVTYEANIDETGFFMSFVAANKNYQEIKGWD